MLLHAVTDGFSIQSSSWTHDRQAVMLLLQIRLLTLVHALHKLQCMHIVCPVLSVPAPYSHMNSKDPFGTIRVARKALSKIR